MRKFLLSAVALLALSAQNAFAINLTFQFDVNSSGPSIYACNAGIKHAKIANICYDNVTNNSCSQLCNEGNLKACTAESSSPASCVCTGEMGANNDGTWRLDYLTATTAAWTDNQTQIGTTTSRKVSANSAGVYGQLFNSNGTLTDSPFANQIKSLSVNLGSEVYNAEYFVDVCYRGPQIDYTNPSGTGLNFGIKARTTLIDLKKADLKGYKELSLLKVKATVLCQMNDKFNYCDADSIPGVELGCGTSTANYNYTASNTDGVDSEGFAPIAVGVNTAKLIEVATMTGSNGHITPRFCQIRYTFKETSQTMRKWKLQQARICTYTEISEPSL